MSVKLSGVTIPLQRAKRPPARPGARRADRESEDPQAGRVEPRRRRRRSRRPARPCSARPKRLRRKLARTTIVTRAANSVIQASQRSAGTECGGVGGFTMIPSSPLNTLENFAGRSCTASASASVTAARYGPVSRAAGKPTTAPRTAATPTATRSGTMSGRSKCSIINPAA